MARLLVLDALGNVFVFVTVNAFVDNHPLELFEQRLVAGNQTRFDERGFGLHVGVGHLDAIVDAADRVADLQADVPKRIQHPINQLGKVGERFAGGHLAVVQKHEINVAVRIQFRAAITADGHQRQRWKFLLGLRRQTAAGGHPEMPQQCVQHGRARPADFASSGAAAMPQLEPVRFHLEKTLAPGEPFRGIRTGWKRQPRLGVPFDLSD